MTDEVTNPDPQAVVEPAAPVDFADHPLHAGLVAHIHNYGGYAVHRLEQLLAEMRTLLSK